MVIIRLYVIRSDGGRLHTERAHNAQLAKWQYLEHAIHENDVRPNTAKVIGYYTKSGDYQPLLDGREV